MYGKITMLLSVFKKLKLSKERKGTDSHARS